MLSLSPIQTILSQGDTVTLEVTTDSENTVVFKSTNSKVATVDEDGVVTAVSQGVAYITAFVDHQSSRIQVDVAGFSILPNTTELEVQAGKFQVVKVATRHPAKLMVSAESSDESVLSVTALGASGYALKGISEGTATVTFTLWDYDPNAEDSSDSDSSSDEMGTIVFDSYEIEVTVGVCNSISITELDTITYEEDGVTTLEVTTDPEGVEYSVVSSNPGVVSVDDDGNLVSEGIGTALVTAFKYDVKDCIPVTVVGLKTFLIGTASVGHVAKIGWNSSEKGLPAFTSSDESIAVVTKEGSLLGVSSGTVTITIELGDYTSTLEVEVVEYFTEKDSIESSDFETIGIFNSKAEIQSYAGARPIKSTVFDYNITLFYIKNNADPNVFEYELAITEADAIRWLALNSSSADSSSED